MESDVWTKILNSVKILNKLRVKHIFLPPDMQILKNIFPMYYFSDAPQKGWSKLRKRKIWDSTWKWGQRISRMMVKGDSKMASGRLFWRAGWTSESLGRDFFREVKLKEDLMDLNMLKELITSGTELKIDLVVSPQKTIEIKRRQYL